MIGDGVDSHEVKELALDLAKAPGRIQRRVPAVLRKGAVEVKKGMRHDFRDKPISKAGHRGYYPHLLRAIGYDELTPYDYEIGIDKNAHQGALGNIIAFGTAHNGPEVDHTAALRREAPAIERHLADTAEESVLGDRSE